MTTKRLLCMQLENSLLREVRSYLDADPRTSVLRNKHMNNYREDELTTTGRRPVPSVVFERSYTESYLKGYVQFFVSKYVGNDRLGAVLDGLAEAAKFWRTQHRPPTLLDYNAVDALLVDFVNSFGTSRHCDVGLYTKDICDKPSPYWAGAETHGAEEFVMRKIELWTEDHTARNPAAGQDGKPHYVATVEIAPFPDKGMPTVVMWGNRVFHLNPEQVQYSDGAPWKYQECFCVVSLTTSPGLPKDD